MIKFDIILPTINRESLQRAVMSVQQQTYTHWHLFIVNDTGYSSGRIEDPEMQCTLMGAGGPHNDSGAYARNYGIMAGNNPWIAYLDCDDEWLPHHLETIAKLIEQNPEATMIRTAGQSFSMKHKSPRSSKLVKKLGPVNSTDILTVGMAHTRDSFNKTTGWNPVDNHDHLLWKELLAAGGRAVESDIVTFQFER